MRKLSDLIFCEELGVGADLTLGFLLLFGGGLFYDQSVAGAQARAAIITRV